MRPESSSGPTPGPLVPLLPCNRSTDAGVSDLAAHSLSRGLWRGLGGRRTVSPDPDTGHSDEQRPLRRVSATFLDGAAPLRGAGRARVSRHRTSQTQDRVSLPGGPAAPAAPAERPGFWERPAGRGGGAGAHWPARSRGRGRILKGRSRGSPVRAGAAAGRGAGRHVAPCRFLFKSL